MSADVSTPHNRDVTHAGSVGFSSGVSGSSLYAGFLVVLCAGLMVWCAAVQERPSAGWHLLASIVISIALLIASEHSAIRLPFKWSTATISVGAICGLGISIWLGPVFGIPLIFFTSFIASWERWHTLALSAENAASATLAGGVAGAIWWWLIPRGEDPLTSVKTTIVFLMVAIIHVLVNFGTVAAGTAIARHESLFTVIRAMAGGTNFFFTIPVLAAFIPIIGNQSLIALILFAAPLAISHFALNNLWQLRKDAQTTLAALTDMLEMRDPYTAFHSERVTDYAMVIAAHVPGFSADNLDVLERASRIHDIGKVAVADAILLKTGALTPEERTTMESHAPVGAALIEKMNVYHDCVDLIRHHHERWDGRGYPAQLATDNIPLGARIMAVADSLDAMTTDRPYRNAMTLSAAIDEIQRNSGTQFDPAIVTAFMESLEDPVYSQLKDRNHQTLAAD